MDTEVKTQKWTKGSMSAAKQITRSSKLRMVAVGTILREEADKEFCEIISRETHDQELRELLHDLTAMCLSRAICVESTIATQFGNCVRKAEALLSTLEGKI